MKTDYEKLEQWRGRLTANESAYHSELVQMDRREQLYLGSREMTPVTEKDRQRDGEPRQAKHVCNIIAENIESEVDSNIPQPKVRARRQKDEMKAKLIEDMIRNELDRLPMEQINDLLERMVPIQGGGFMLVEWDNMAGTHHTVGEVTVSAVHPKQVIPQDGVYSGIEDMDYIILKVPQTKAYIKRIYDVDVSDESESEPEVKSAGDGDTAADMVTQYIAYYRNDRGGIGMYSWVNDIQLVDYEEYQARRLRRCRKCGALEPIGVEALEEPTYDGTYPGREYAEPISLDAKETGSGLPKKAFRGDSDFPPENPLKTAQGEIPLDPLGTENMDEDGLFQREIQRSDFALERRSDRAGGYPADSRMEQSDVRDDEAEWMPGIYDGRNGAQSVRTKCPYCGSSDWEESQEDFEEIWQPVTTAAGTEIPGVMEQTDGMGMIVSMEPTRIPYYKPDIYPVVQIKNVSVFGQFLGDSDADKIADQQNTLNRISKKLLDRIVGAGTRITLPDDPSCYIDTEDNTVIRIGSAADKALIGSYDFSGDLQYELAYYSAVYEEARRILGITDSFQGRKDATATSGKAKEFAAAQSAGRLQSKRVMKDAAWSRLFELIFKFRLAYADEPRPVYYRDENGETRYDMFDRYDFLEQDESGQWYWNDQFLFSCDASAPLANNQTAMWQETTSHLQAGAYGDPAQIDTLILYWTKMELLHYPGAGETKKYLEGKKQEEIQQQMQMQQMQMQQQQMMARAAASQARADVRADMGERGAE